MALKCKVAIPQCIYEASRPAMRVCRVMGMFPVATESSGPKRVLKWSKGYAFYGYLLGAVLLSATYAGWISDVMAEPDKSIRVVTQSDIYITFCDITVVELVMIFSIYVIPLHFKSFCLYVECINDADSILLTNNFRRYKNMSQRVLTAILITATGVLIADIVTQFLAFGDKIPFQFIVEAYMGFYLTHYIILITHYELWHLGYCVLVRLKKLNRLLQNEIDKKDNKIMTVTNGHLGDLSFIPFKKGAIDKKNLDYVIDSLQGDGATRTVYPAFKKDAKYENKTDDDHILKLMRAYLRLCDAVEIQNDLLGFVGAILITGILLQLILSTYKLFLEVGGSRQNPYVALMMMVWCIAHLIRLFLIVEPAYACSNESQNTKDLVCKLLCSNSSEQVKVQLDAFAMALCHRKIEFFASGLATIDRSLVTSVIGAITTYLVILLQFVKTE